MAEKPGNQKKGRNGQEKKPRGCHLWIRTAIKNQGAIEKYEKMQSY